MKTKFNKRICLIGIAGLLLSVSTVFAQPPGPALKDPESMKTRMEARMKAMEQKLNLTEEQQKLLEANRIKHREEAEKFHENLRAAREAMRAELEKPELNMDKINQLHSEEKDLMAKLADYRLEGILEVRKILTPEQFVEFGKLIGERRHGRGMGMKQGPPDLPEGPSEE